MRSVRSIRYIIRDGGSLKGMTSWDGHKNGYMAGDNNFVLDFNNNPNYGPIPEYMINVPLGADASETESNFMQLFAGYTDPGLYSSGAVQWYNPMIIFDFTFGSGNLIDKNTLPAQNCIFARHDQSRYGQNILRDGVVALSDEG